ncbi:hypothetical protein V2O64_15535 [Verrucomicrobiaceae bacterium 227]
MDPSTEFFRELPETEWSLLESVGQDEFGSSAWEEDYSLAVHDYLRCLGQREDEALVLSKKFFDQLFSRIDDGGDNELAGSFRNYLKSALHRFVSKEISPAPVTQIVEQAFDRAWLLGLMKKALDALQNEMEQTGDAHLFSILSPILDGRNPSTPRAELASQLDLQVNELTTTILKMRQRYRLFLEQELRQSVTTQEELEEEIRHLQSIWS